MAAAGAAAALRDARLNGLKVQDLSEIAGCPTDERGGYAGQRDYVENSGALGTHVGWKVGATNAAAQARTFIFYIIFLADCGITQIIFILLAVLSARSNPWVSARFMDPCSAAA